MVSSVLNVWNPGARALVAGKRGRENGEERGHHEGYEEHEGVAGKRKRQNGEEAGSEVRRTGSGQRYRVLEPPSTETSSAGDDWPPLGQQEGNSGLQRQQSKKERPRRQIAISERGGPRATESAPEIRDGGLRLSPPFHKLDDAPLTQKVFKLGRGKDLLCCVDEFHCAGMVVLTENAHGINQAGPGLFSKQARRSFLAGKKQGRPVVMVGTGTGLLNQEVVKVAKLLLRNAETAKFDRELVQQCFQSFYLFRGDT